MTGDSEGEYDVCVERGGGVGDWGQSGMDWHVRYCTAALPCTTHGKSLLAIAAQVITLITFVAQLAAFSTDKQ